ncbi:MAG TPA: cell wall-binding protein, partial [Lachnoclostridium sp.]|nr:cell wall-binding protein [Lachnoclostridium sp.]
MTAEQNRQAVCDRYATLIGRNIYSQNLRDYCFKKYSDGNYYSDCSSSICHSYQEAGHGFGNLNTAGIYQSGKLTTVDAGIVAGIPDVSRLR